MKFCVGLYNFLITKHMDQKTCQILPKIQCQDCKKEFSPTHQELYCMDCQWKCQFCENEIKKGTERWQFSDTKRLLCDRCATYQHLAYQAQFMDRRCHHH